MLLGLVWLVRAAPPDALASLASAAGRARPLDRVRNRPLALCPERAVSRHPARGAVPGADLALRHSHRVSLEPPDGAVANDLRHQSDGGSGGRLSLEPAWQRPASWCAARHLHRRGAESWSSPGPSSSVGSSARSRTSSDGDIAVRVDNIGKQYRIGTRRAPGTVMLREALTDLGRAPFRKLRSLGRRLRRGLPAADVPTERARSHLGAAQRVLHGAARPDHRHHRTERCRQEHAAQDPVAHHRAHRGPGRDPRAGRLAPRGGHRLSPRADRAARTSS